jgi:hypothetical protein
MSIEHIAIVGAGHPGGCATGALRAAGFKDRITLVGSEGYAPYERPPLTKELLADTVSIKSGHGSRHGRRGGALTALPSDAATEGDDR